MSQLKCLTYIVDEPSTLEKVQESLEGCLQLMVDAAPKAGNSIIQEKDGSRPVCLTPLPSVSSKESASSSLRRVEQAVNYNLKRGWHVDPLQSNISQPKKAKLEPLEDDTEIAFSLPKESSSYSHPFENDANPSDDQVTHCICSNSPPTLESDSHEKVPPAPSASESTISNASPSEEGLKITGLRMKYNLHKVDMDNLENDTDLTDTIIYLAQEILQDQFPNMEGLEDPVLGPVLKFSEHRGEFVQILYTGGHHWVTVSNIGCQKGDINYFDSFSSGKPTSLVSKQIARMLHEEGPRIKIVVQPVQQQTNLVDCGVFAIAFATSLVNAEDPCKVQYDHTLLRSHLKESLMSSNLELFPKAQGSRNLKCCLLKVTYVNVMCICRMPWEKDTVSAQCDTCEEWYHKQCVPSIPDNVLQGNVPWTCKKCM